MIRSISAKKLKALGKIPVSSITSPRTPIARGGKPKPKRRKPSEFARIYGSKERVAWVKSQPCVYCDLLSPFIGNATRGTCHNAHTVTGGMGRKAGYTTIIPLCASHHRRYDEHQAPFKDSFARDYMREAAAYVERAWLAHLNASPDA